MDLHILGCPMYFNNVKLFSKKSKLITLQALIAANFSLIHVCMLTEALLQEQPKEFRYINGY